MTACKPDWELIQSLYLKGLRPSQIEQQTGVKADTVSARANRKGWRKHLIQSSVVVSGLNPKLPEEPDDSPALAKQSARVREGLASVLTRFVEKIESMPVLTHKAALRASGELESVVRNAKVVFGWSEGQSTPAVRISIMGSAVAIAQEPSPAPVIECESTKVLPPPSDS